MALRKAAAHLQVTEYFVQHRELHSWEAVPSRGSEPPASQTPTAESMKCKTTLRARVPGPLHLLSLSQSPRGHIRAGSHTVAHSRQARAGVGEGRLGGSRADTKKVLSARHGRKLSWSTPQGARCPVEPSSTRAEGLWDHLPCPHMSAHRIGNKFLPEDKPCSENLLAPAAKHWSPLPSWPNSSYKWRQITDPPPPRGSSLNEVPGKEKEGPQPRGLPIGQAPGIRGQDCSSEGGWQRCPVLPTREMLGEPSSLHPDAAGGDLPHARCHV